jgi:hypothetical protein
MVWEVTGLPVSLRTAEARMLRAGLVGDIAGRNRILDTELADGWWPEVLSAAFVIVASQRFREFGNRHLVTVFARRFVGRAPGAEGFSPRTVEAVVRGTIGEAWLLESVDPGLGLEIIDAGLFALVDDLGLDDEQCEQVLARAEAALSAIALPARDASTAEGVPASYHRRTGQRYLTDADQLPDLTRRVRQPQRPPAAPKSRKAARKLPPALEPATVVGRYLRSVALHQQGPDRTAETDDQELMTLALATLVVLLPRYLPLNPDPREITALVKLTWQTFRPPTDPITMEHVVRRALDGELPIADISSSDRYTTAVLVLTAISDIWNSNARAIGTVIADTENIVISEGKSLTPA